MRSPLPLVVAFALLAGCGGGGGGAVTTPTTPFSILNRALIPVGTRLFVESALAGQTKRNQVYLITSAGVTQLTSSFVNAEDPVPSPDGTQVAFRGDATGTNEDLWVVNVDGSGLRQLTNDAQHEGYPAWSPDGAQIAFMRHITPELNVIMLMNADGSNQRMINNRPVLGGLSFNPGGGSVIWGCPRRDGLINVNTDGSNERVQAGSQFGDLGPQWSSNGLLLAVDFATILADDRDDHIFVMNPDGSGRRQVTSGPGGNRLAWWGPGSNQLTFASKRVGTYQIWIVNADGSNLQQLTNSATHEVDQPAWWPR